MHLGDDPRATRRAARQAARADRRDERTTRRVQRLSPTSSPSDGLAPLATAGGAGPVMMTPAELEAGGEQYAPSEPGAVPAGDPGAPAIAPAGGGIMPLVLGAGVVLLSMLA